MNVALPSAAIRLCSLRHPAATRAVGPPLSVAFRSVATYPSPGGGRTGKKANRKKFNFLNGDRLVATEKGPRSRMEVRIRDDIFYHRRVQYRESISENVEKHIRYLPENVKQYVFFRAKKCATANTGFLGVRKAPGVVMHRILQMVEGELLRPENRDHLVELIESVGVTPPSDEEWARYTDSKTGEININLYHHHKLEELIRRFFFGAGRAPLYRKFQAFVVLNRNNFDACPPMRMWSLNQGPIRDEELLERSEVKVVCDIAMELAKFQRLPLDKAFGKLSDEEKEKLSCYASDNADKLLREYEQERLFSARVLSGVAALREVRALTTPLLTYYHHEYYKRIIEKNGNVEVTLNSVKKEVPKWHSLPEEVRLKYYCFERAAQVHPVGGAHLYTRCACRDYGLTREEAMERWAELTDLQKAALNFCFYAPITATPRSSTAFRRFYWKQCIAHGLVMAGKACGNRAFYLRVRNTWMEMSADERAQYEETDSFSSVFPLHPPTPAEEQSEDNCSASLNGSSACAPVQFSSKNGIVGETATKMPVVMSSGECLPASAEDNDSEMFYFEDENIDDNDGDVSGDVPSSAHARNHRGSLPHGHSRDEEGSFESGGRVVSISI